MKRDTTQRHDPQDTETGLGPAASGAASQTPPVEAFRHALSVVEKGVPAIAILLVITAVGFLYIGRDMVFALWALTALVISAGASADYFAEGPARLTISRAAAAVERVDARGALLDLID